VSGSKRGLWAGFTFLLGFGAAIWLSGAAVGELRGPRADLMREVNSLRAAAGVGALRADRHLGQLAQQQAQSLARGSSVASARTAADLERGARSLGWRGSAPLLELRLHAADLAAALASAASGGLLEPGRANVGVGVAPAQNGERVAVVLLDSAGR
jgi:hypothetical protein